MFVYVVTKFVSSDDISSRKSDMMRRKLCSVLTNKDVLISLKTSACIINVQAENNLHDLLFAKCFKLTNSFGFF